jgi:osmotically-inducible protein OsmY
MNNKLLVAALVCAGSLGLGACASGYRNTAPDVALVQPSTDRAISSTIKAAYAADARMVASHVDVATMNGQVELSGYAGSQDEKDRAESIARSATGVTGVHNDIQVKPATP